MHELKPVAALPLRDGTQVEIAEIVAPLDAALSAPLAAEIANMDPWRRYGFAAERLQGFIAQPSPQAQRYLVREETRVLGVVVLKPGWMFGTYLNFLAVLAAGQGRGIGGGVLEWMHAEGVRRGERNQFVATSAFNAGALRFYQRHGFARVADLPGLIRDDETEILLRRRLLPRDGAGAD